MNWSALRISVCLSLLVFSACGTEKVESLPDGRGLLDAVYKNMGRIYSYHANALLEADGGQATIDGDFGVDRVRFTMQRFDGEQMRVLILDKMAYVSVGSDTSWSVDTTGGALAMSQLITGPAGPKLGVTRDQTVISVGTEQIDGYTTTHLRVERTAPIDIWVGIDSSAGPIVRRIRMPSTSTPGGSATITYTDFNKDFQISAPRVVQP